MRVSVLLWITSLLLLAACAPRQTEPDQDAALDTPAELDTTQTPLAVDEPAGGRTAAAVASFTEVGRSGVTGRAEFYEAPEGVRVLAEVGGLSTGSYRLRILEQTSCANLEDLQPFGEAAQGDPAGHLGTLTVAGEGTVLHEAVISTLTLHDEPSVVGQAVVVTAGQGDQVFACGVVEDAPGGGILQP